jgi:hypothetical protein
VTTSYKAAAVAEARLKSTRRRIQRYLDGMTVVVSTTTDKTEPPK